MSDPLPDPASDDDTAARLLAEAAPGDNAPPLSVSELSAALKRTVEDGFGHVRVRGEISGFKRAASGHCYFTLKDDNALIDAVIWQGQAASAALPARGRDRGDRDRQAHHLSRPLEIPDRRRAAGAGGRRRADGAARQAKARLAAEGLFDRERKQPLPFCPRAIGVVTSPTGAVIRDILHRLEDRFPTHVIVWPVPVQGEGAAAKVAAAIAASMRSTRRAGAAPRPADRRARRRLDRGSVGVQRGGRRARGRRLPHPDRSRAVGHETDTTLADFAADLRAPTPTAAAEMAVPVRAELQAQLATWGSRMIGAANRHQSLASERMAALARHLPKREALYAPQRQRLDDAGERLDRNQRHRLAVITERLATRSGALRPALLARRWDRDRARLEGLERLLVSLDPRALLSRGYAMVRDSGGAIVTTAVKARGAGHLRLQFADGEVPVEIADSGAPAALSAPAPAPKPVRKPPTATPGRGQGELF